MNWHPQSQFSMCAEASDLSLRKLRLWKSKGVVTESNEAFDCGNPSKGELEIQKLHRPSSMSKRDIAKLDFPKMEMANCFKKEEVLCFHRIMQINKEPKSRNPFPSHCLQIGTHDMTIQCRKCNCRTSFCLDCHSEAPAMDQMEDGCVMKPKGQKGRTAIHVGKSRLSPSPPKKHVMVPMVVIGNQFRIGERNKEI